MAANGWQSGPSDTSDPTSLSSRMRLRRDQKFLIPVLERCAVEAGRPIAVLDIGGRIRTWELNGLLDRSIIEHLVIANYHEVGVPKPPHPKVTYMDDVDGRDLPFAAHDFDLVFSNSVIEHVGERDSQRTMISEILRVGGSVFLQCPNKRFPIEPHFFQPPYVVPYFQYLPARARVWLVQRLPLAHCGTANDRAHAKSIVDDVHLLTMGQLRRLFPAEINASFHTEKIFGFNKSLIAIVERPRLGTKPPITAAELSGR
jgi:hypothetical protein